MSQETLDEKTGADTEVCVKIYGTRWPYYWYIKGITQIGTKTDTREPSTRKEWRQYDNNESRELETERLGVQNHH